MLKFIVAAVNQGSNDAFAQAEMATGLSEGTRTALRVRRIEWWLPAIGGVSSDVLVQLFRRSQSAASYSSSAMIASCAKYAKFTTSGATVTEQFPNVQTWERDEDLLIVEPTLYLVIDSTSTSASNSATCRVWYETRTITENERLTINSMSAG